MMSEKSYDLHQTPNKSNVISLKLNSQILSKIQELERNSNENNINEIEIEFCNQNEAIIYIGKESYNLTTVGISEGISEVYEIEESNKSMKCLGPITSRYQVHSNLEKTSKDLREKTEKEVTKREETKSISINHIPSSIKTSSISKILHITKDNQIHNNVSSNNNNNNNNNKTNRLSLANQSSLTSITNTKEICSNNQINSIKEKNILDVAWLVLKSLPRSICAKDIIDFFKGLRINNIFVYYNLSLNHETSNKKRKKEIDDFFNADVYVEFDTILGADFGLLRNNEKMNTKNLSIPNIKIQQISIKVESISKIEALWAKSTCLRIDGKDRDGYIYNSNVMSTIPFHQNPFEISLKWNEILINIPHFHPDNIHSGNLNNNKMHSNIISKSTFNLLNPISEGKFGGGIGYVLTPCHNNNNVSDKLECLDLVSNIQIRNLNQLLNEISDILYKLNQIWSGFILQISLSDKNHSSKNEIINHSMDICSRMISLYTMIYSNFRIDYYLNSNIS
jgi:hypothetical protein